MVSHETNFSPIFNVFPSAWSYSTFILGTIIHILYIVGSMNIIKMSEICLFFLMFYLWNELSSSGQWLRLPCKITFRFCPKGLSCFVSKYIVLREDWTFSKIFSYQYNKVWAHPAKMYFLIINYICVKTIVQTQSFSKT